MYYTRLESFHTHDPVYQKLRTGPNYFFFGEDRVAKDYVTTGLYERHLMQWSLDNFVSPDKNVLDIGAHVGTYTCMYARKAKHVYSFECSPKSFNYMCANIALQELDYKVTKYNVALSSENGTTDYYIRDPLDGGGNGISKFEYDNLKKTPSIAVPKRTLDSFELTNINFIKIDVEGHEKEVLEGAVETLKNNNYPPIMFESWAEHQEQHHYPSIQLRKELFTFIESLGYTITPVDRSEMFLAHIPK